MGRAWCLAEIERIVAALSPDGLLERLIQGYEAVMHARFEQEFKLPTRLACYESLPDMQARLRSERPKLSRTAIAWRFLIEYVVAVPPRGDASFSLSTGGELLALAAEMQDLASSLDAIDHRMSDTQLALTRTGMLVETSADAYQQSQWRFFDARLGPDIDQADRRFSDHFADPVVSPSTRRAELNAVMVYESGLTLDDLEMILDELVVIGLETPDAVVAWERDALIAKLHEKTGWASETVAHGSVVLGAAATWVVLRRRRRMEPRRCRAVALSTATVLCPATAASPV